LQKYSFKTDQGSSIPKTSLINRFQNNGCQKALSTSVDQRKPPFRLPWRDPWGSPGEVTEAALAEPLGRSPPKCETQCVEDRPRSLCKMSVNSVQQFQTAVQTRTKLQVNKSYLLRVTVRLRRYTAITGLVVKPADSQQWLSFLFVIATTE